jgi:hypothetical protein
MSQVPGLGYVTSYFHSTLFHYLKMFSLFLFGLLHTRL